MSRAYESTATYRCWNCRTVATYRRLFVITWIDGRPERVYDVQLWSRLRCQVCGESLEFVAERDTADAETFCRSRCQPAGSRRETCQCRSCFGTQHGVLQ